MSNRDRIYAIAWRGRGTLDPADNLERVQERSCHGCKLNERNEWQGVAKWVCRIARRKASLEISETQRCKKYQPAGKAMTLDHSEQVEELLLAWHRWQAGYRPNLGAGRCDPTCREYRSGNQWLDAKERAAIADEKIWKANSEIVECLVDTLSWQHRAAIQVSMKNKRVGVSVWGNARLTAEESHQLYQEAKSILLPMLFSRGLIKPEPIEKNISGAEFDAAGVVWGAL